MLNSLYQLLYARLFLHAELKFKNYMLSAESVQHVETETQYKTYKDSAQEISFSLYAVNQTS